SLAAAWRLCCWRCDGRGVLHSFPTRRSSDLRDDGVHLLVGELAEGRPLHNHPALCRDPALRCNRLGGDLVVARDHTDLDPRALRSEEHTSELQSRENLVCRLLLEKKTNQQEN